MYTYIHIYITILYHIRNLKNSSCAPGPVKKSCSKTRIPCSCDDPGSGSKSMSDLEKKI